ERLGLAGDPEVHRVRHDEARLLHLLEDLELERRVDVAEQDERRAARGGRDLGAEVGEDVELRVERGAARERRVVATGPAERLARGALDAVGGDAVRAERLEELLREVVSDDAEEIDPGEQ